MARILLLTLLFTLVYSWEELKRAVRVLFRRTVIEKRPFRIDEVVSTAVVFAIVPLSLTALLVSANPFRTLGILVLALLAIASAAFVSAIMLRRENVLAAGLSLASLAMPAAGNLAILPRKLLGRFALYLALPPAVGLAMRLATHNSATPAELLPNIDVLILILVGALFAQIAAEFLARHLRALRHFGLFAFYRVALGVALAGVMLAGII